MNNTTLFVKEKTYDNFASEKVNVIKNRLLGDYNSNGNYVISDHIINELILVKKVKTNSFGSAVHCVANLFDLGEIEFEVVFKKNSKLNIAVAELYLLESVDLINSYVTNTLRTPIAKFTEAIGEQFISKSLAVFNVEDLDNITDDTTSGGAGDDSQTFNVEAYNLHYITERKKFVEMLDKLTSKDTEKAYEIFVNKKLDILKNSQSLYSKEVLNEINSDIDTIKEYFLKGKKNKNKALYEVVEKAVETVDGTNKNFASDEIAIKQESEIFMNAFSSKINKLHKVAFEHVKGMGEDFAKTAEDIVQTTSKPETIIKTVTEPGKIVSDYSASEGFNVKQQKSEEEVSLKNYFKLPTFENKPEPEKEAQTPKTQAPMPEQTRKVTPPTPEPKQQETEPVIEKLQTKKRDIEIEKFPEGEYNL